MYLEKKEQVPKMRSKARKKENCGKMLLEKI